MPGDAKLGLVVGVGLVILVAVLFRRDGSLFLPASPKAAVAPAGAGSVPGRPPVLVPAQSAGARQATLSALSGRVHRVKEGETLAGLAERYYGDGSQSDLLLEANRDQLSGPERLPAGMVLLVPDLPE